MNEIAMILAVGTMILSVGTALCIVIYHACHSHSEKAEYSIVALNFFLGWTVVGWVVALGWALRDPSSGGNLLPEFSRKIR